MRNLICACTAALLLAALAQAAPTATMPASCPATPFIDDSALSAPATIFVSPGGDDAGDGSRNKPLRRISDAVAKARAGDVIEVTGGTYRGENIEFKADGMAGKPIVLRAADGAEVMIKGSALVTQWSRVEGDMPIYKHEGWKHFFNKWDPVFLADDSEERIAAIRKARKRLHAGHMPYQRMFVDGKYVNEAPRLDRMKPGTFFIDRSAKTLYVWLEDGSNPATRQVEVTDTGLPLLTTADKSWLLIKGLKFEHCANGPQGSAAFRVSGGSNVLVDSCSVSWVSGAGATLGGTGNIFRRCTFNHNGQLGLHSSRAVSCMALQCETSYNDAHPDKQYDPGWEGGGNKISRSKGFIMDGHLAHDNNGSGIWFDVDNQNAVIRNCVSYMNSHGIHYEISYTALMYNNVLFKNTCWGANPNAPHGQGIYISSSSGCRVYNNTCWGNETYGIASNSTVRGDGSKRQVTSYANRLFNNIVAENTTKNPNGKSYSIGYGHSKDSKTPPKLDNALVPMEKSVSDYNLFYLSKKQAFFIGPGSSRPVTLKQWQEVSGQDMNSIWGDPKFVAPDKGDFSLQPNSPARNAGLPLAEVQTDAKGTLRPQEGKFDIGAMEFKSN